MLSDKQILEMWVNAEPSEDKSASWHFARAIEAEVRKQYEALIRQLRDALALEVLEWEPAFLAGLYESEDPAENIARAQILAALKAAKARLGDADGKP